MRFWALEAPGTVTSIFSTLLLGASVIVQLVSLFRSLDARDHEVPHYRVMIRWVLAGVLLLCAGVLLSILSAA